MEMPGGDSGPDAEEPALTLAAGEGGEGEKVSSRQQGGGVGPGSLRVEECGTSGGEVAQEDEEMISASHDLSSSANHSPSSTTESSSTSTKRYIPLFMIPCHVSSYHSGLRCCVISPNLSQKQHKAAFK